MWHKADLDKVAQNSESIQMPREDWIHQHDAEKHAETVIAETLKMFSSRPVGKSANEKLQSSKNLAEGVQEVPREAVSVA